MKKRTFISILLSLAMLLSLALCGSAAAFADDAVAKPAQQLKLISSQIDSLKQNDSVNTWYYTVADLDHDGCLEFIAASIHPADRSTNLKVWTVSKDAASLAECRLDKSDDESFPDIMTDTADTYYVKDTDTWYYMVYDNVVLSDTEVYTVKTAVDLKNGIIGFDAYAIEHTEIVNGAKNVSHTDANGLAISAEQYNASGVNAFAGADRSNTAFEWLTPHRPLLLSPHRSPSPSRYSRPGSPSPKTPQMRTEVSAETPSLLPVPTPMSL